jgi:hypothetical protein
MRTLCRIPSGYSPAPPPPHAVWLGPADVRAKAACARRVYALLEKTYRSIGGITRGSGFQNPEDMRRSIPVWRVVFHQGGIVSAMLFKQKGAFLKMVAYAAADSAPEAVKEADVACFLECAHGEISGALLFRVLKQAKGAWRDLLLDPAAAMPERAVRTVDDFGRERLRDEENGKTLAKLEAAYPEVLARAYVRGIGGVFKLKVLMGRLVPVHLADVNQAPARTGGGAAGLPAGVPVPGPACKARHRTVARREDPALLRKVQKNSGKRRLRVLQRV